MIGDEQSEDLGVGSDLLLDVEASDSARHLDRQPARGSWSRTAEMAASTSSPERTTFSLRPSRVADDAAKRV